MTKRLILAALPLLAACAAAGASSAALKGTKWTFTLIDGKPPVSSKAALTIEAARIGANVGCNGLGGDLRIKSGRLVTGPMISTMMYCDGLMEQERAISELLEADPKFRVAGKKLVLDSGAHRAELKRAN